MQAEAQLTEAEAAALAHLDLSSNIQSMAEKTFANNSGNFWQLLVPSPRSAKLKFTLPS